MTILKLSLIYLSKVVPASILLPLAPALTRYRNNPKEFKVIAWFLIIGGITNVVTSIMAMKVMNNMPVLHFYTLAETIILLVFYHEIFKGKKLGRYTIGMMVGFGIFFIIAISTFQNVREYNNYSKSIESMLLIFLSLSYFIMSLDHTHDVNSTYRKALTYINSGILIYFSGSLIIFVLYIIFQPNRSLSILVWDIHGTILLLMYVLFSIGLWKHKP